MESTSSDTPINNCKSHAAWAVKTSSAAEGFKKMCILCESSHMNVCNLEWAAHPKMAQGVGGKLLGSEVL